MMKLISKAMTIVLLCLGGTTQGQGHDANWIFGNGNHLEFLTSGPRVLPGVPEYNAFEAATTISDKSGQLVMYSNNVKFWGSDLMTIPGSDSLNPGMGGVNGSSLTNACIALPWPGDTTDNLFAVFYTDEYTRRVRYSLFDKTLNEGRTGLVEGFINRPIWSSSVAEAITAVRHGNGRDWWIISRTYLPAFDSIILALVNPNGVQLTLGTPVGFDTGFGGEMSVSPSGERLAISFGYEGLHKAFGFYAFNRCDGQVVLLDTLIPKPGFPFYAVAFSPNGEKIYVGTTIKHAVMKLELKDGNLVDTLIYKIPAEDGFSNQGGQLQLGPDGKIYIVSYRISPIHGLPDFSEYLAVIHEPNRSALNCAFDTFGIYLGGMPTIGVYSLPNFANYDLGPLVGSPCDSLSPPQDTTTTSINPVLPPQGEWSITPSISSGWYQINSTQEGWLLVHDLFGREVVRQWFSGTTPFDLNGLPAGMYVAAVMVDGAMQGKVHKLLKQ